MMDFSLAESQQAVAGLAAQVLADPKADAWKELAQAGLLALSVPAQLGGDGLGVLEVAVLLTEIGRRALPGPPPKALATLMTGVLPVVRWGSSELQRALLPAVAAGELILTAAIREPSDPEPDSPATAVTDVPSRGGQGGSSPRVSTVSGIKVGVPYAAQAARILVAASLAPGAASPAAGAASLAAGAASPAAGAASPAAGAASPAAGAASPAAGAASPAVGAASPAAGATGVVIVDPAADGVSLTRTPSSAGQPEYTLRLDRTPVESVLGPAACARDLYQLAVAGACAVADGAVAGALALTRDHVATREQFGRPLPRSRRSPSRSPRSTSRPARCIWPPCRRAGGSRRAGRPAPISTWRGTGAPSTHPGPFGYVITCTAGSGWT